MKTVTGQLRPGQLPLDNFPLDNLPRTTPPSGIWVEIVRVIHFRGGPIVHGGSCPGGVVRGGKLSREELSYNRAHNETEICCICRSFIYKLGHILQYKLKYAWPIEYQ